MTGAPKIAAYSTQRFTPRICLSRSAHDPECDRAAHFVRHQLLQGLKDGTLKFWDMDFEKLVSNGNQVPNYGGLLLDNINDGLGSAGSGDFDVQVRIPYTQELADFVKQYSASGKGDDLYVYLYNFAGEADTLGECTTGNSSKPADCGEAQAGFEEWAAVLGENGGGPPTGVPLPSTALLFGAGLIAIGRRRKH